MDGGRDLTSTRPDLHGTDRHAVDTPALLVDLDILDANIARIAGTCRRHGIAWRPHTKGIKVPPIAHRLLAPGAIGITCAKLSEAEVMAAAGIGDILIANQIVGAQKIARLVDVRRRADVIVAVDNPDNVAALAAAARGAGVTVRLVIEVDIGMQRAGVESGAACVALARTIAGQAGVEFAGVMGWEGHAAAMLDPAQKSHAVTAAVRNLTQCAEQCRVEGLTAAIVSCGGTGTYWLSAAQAGVTEIQAGGGVFGDVHYRKDYGVEHPYALTLMTTVTSRPNPCRIVCDAGKKAMSGDTALPLPIGLGPARKVRLSAEHATIELEAPADAPCVGEHLEFVVGYSDTTVHLHETLHGVRGGRIEAVWPILGRGKLQ
jgi:D-serine deaminase-like pyridoxal phosphate-dependent protein